MATTLDQEQIEQVTPIAPRMQPVETMPDRTGVDVSRELGRRLLVRYLSKAQVTDFIAGSTRPHWVTPTPISSTDTAAWLALPDPRLPREYALLLDPSRIAVIRGPAWIRLGQGIEYYLPDGFPEDAIVDSRVIEVR